MARKNQHSFSKLQRERKKAEKTAQKRAEKAAKKENPDGIAEITDLDAPVTEDDAATTE